MQSTVEHKAYKAYKAYASPYKCGTRKCGLRLTEKMVIARADPKNFLNKGTELDIETSFYWATLNKRCYITITRNTIMRSKGHELLLISWWNPAYLWCNIKNQRITLKVLKHYSLNIFITCKKSVLWIWFIFVQPEHCEYTWNF